MANPWANLINLNLNLLLFSQFLCTFCHNHIRFTATLESKNQKTGVENWGCLKVLNNIKWVLNEHEDHSGSIFKRCEEQPFPTCSTFSFLGKIEDRNILRYLEANIDLATSDA